MMHVDASQALYALDALIAGQRATQNLPAPEVVHPPYGPHNWPPDYALVLGWRQQQLARFEEDEDLLASANAYYAGKDLDPAAPTYAKDLAGRCAAWITHWTDTFDPRLAASGKSTRMPFVLFERQEQLVQFIIACMVADAPGLVEKARDMGATWVCCGISAWLWRYFDGSTVGWGSYGQDKVDRIGDPKSIFEKIRMLILGLPASLRPDVASGVHLVQHTCRNPDNGSVISGEVGDNIGRGGRSRIYFVDEAAHLQHPEAAEAALSGTTRCRIDLSTVSGPGTVFSRKRDLGVIWEVGAPVRRDTTNVFVMDWTDHPEKTREWYANEVKKYAATPHVVAREIDRNPLGAQEGVIIRYDWVEAAIDAHLLLPGFDTSGGWWGGLDLADDGPDVNALIRGQGLVVRLAEEINDRDPGAVARRTFRTCREETSPIELQWDSGGGFGGSVKSEFNRITQDEGVDLSWLSLTAWSASAAVVKPNEPVFAEDIPKKARGEKVVLNGDFFENFKAQAWWTVAQSFYKTWRTVTAFRAGAFEVEAQDSAEVVYAVRDDEGRITRYKVGELISIAKAKIDPKVLAKLQRELSQATAGQSSRLKMLVNKAPDGAKSPNMADGLVMGRFPAPKPAKQIVGLFGPKVFEGQ